jgi:P pilus assembly chaperone PapD
MLLRLMSLLLLLAGVGYAQLAWSPWDGFANVPELSYRVASRLNTNTSTEYLIQFQNQTPRKLTFSWTFVSDTGRDIQWSTVTVGPNSLHKNFTVCSNGTTVSHVRVRGVRDAGKYDW